MVAGLARLDVARPTHQERNPQSSIVEVALLAAKHDTGMRVDVRAKETARVLLVDETILAAVVAREEDDGVLIEG